MLAVTLLLFSAFLHQSFCHGTGPVVDGWSNMTCCHYLAPRCPTGFGCHENPQKWGCRCVMPHAMQLMRMRQADLVRAKYGLPVYNDNHDHGD